MISIFGLFIAHDLNHWQVLKLDDKIGLTRNASDQLLSILLFQSAPLQNLLSSNFLTDLGRYCSSAHQAHR